MKNELFKIPGFSKYSIDELGTVSNGDGLPIRDFVNCKTHYRQLTIVNDAGERKTIQVHVLVALTFHGERPSNGHDAAHENGDRLDCSRENVSWKTKKENGQDRVKHGTNLPGELNRAARFTNGGARVLAWIGAYGLAPACKLAEIFDVSDETILRLWRKQSWASFTIDIPKAKNLCPNRGKRRPEQQ